MDRPYVEELHIKNYGCIRDATFRFTPLHALIGPNDSGKSTVLRALRTLAFLLNDSVNQREQNALRQAILASKSPQFEVSAAAMSWQVGFGDTADFRWRTLPRAEESRPWPDDAPSSTFRPLRGMSPARDIAQAIRGAQLVRLDPDSLRIPHPLIPDGQPLRFIDEHGTGLPALYDALVVRDLPVYIALNEQLARLFPSVKSVQLMNPNASTKAIAVKLTDGTVVPTELMSEGLLYYLAFAILPHLDPTPLLLIEEPENGLHPARIAEVMRVLRAISDKTQVILATHSPLVINELQPEEVTVVTRSKEQGTKATLLKDTPNFEERSKVYALGELWLSYANGEDEAPLLQGGPRP
ncbi:MAG: ATP-binding protein [Minicystis sp.]